MRRTALILGGIAAIAAAGWTGLWFWAKGEMEAGIDARLAALAEAGRPARHATRETGGFPLALETRLGGLEMTLAGGEGWTLTLEAPEATARAAMLAPGTVTVDLPPRMRAVLTDAAGALPVDVESEALALEFLPAGEGATEVRLTAVSITMVPAEPDPARFVGVEAGDVRATLRTRPGHPAATEIEVASIGLLASFPALEGTRAVTLDWLLEGVRLTAQGTLRDAVDAEMLLSGFGRFAVSGEAGRSDLGFEVAAERPEDAFTLTLTQSRLLGEAVIDEGVLALSGTAQEAAGMLVQAAPEGKIEGGVTMPRAELRLRLPVVPAETMTDFALHLDLPEISGDPRLWATLDPEGRLLHDPGRIALAIEGTARRAPPFGTPLPFEFGNVLVEGAELRLLGAEAALAGDVEFVTPFSLPDGLVTLTARRVVDLADRLVRAKLITARERDLFLALATQYSRQGDAPDELVTDFRFGPTGVAANGLPVMSLE